MPKIRSLFIYPVKSLGGIELESSELDSSGLQYDRSWMLVDERGQFLTQRDHRQMALLKTTREASGFGISDTVTGSRISIPFSLSQGERMMVTVWDDSCLAIAADTATNQWFSHRLGQACKLVYMPPDSVRKVDPVYARYNEQTRFTDGYPILILSIAALDLLNKKTGLEQDIRRFRPNIVVGDSEAHEEDSWSQIRIGSIPFYVAKPCARCTVTTIDPDTATKGPEPLRTLALYRKKNSKIYFGQNIIALSSGQIACGDSIDIVKRQAPLFDHS